MTNLGEFISWSDHCNIQLHTGVNFKMDFSFLHWSIIICMSLCESIITRCKRRFKATNYPSSYGDWFHEHDKRIEDFNGLLGIQIWI